MKIFIFVIKFLRNVVFLFIGLCTLNFLEKKIIEKIKGDIMLMLLLFLADIIFLFVIHRQFISKNKLKASHRNSLLIISFFIIILVLLLAKA
ncbi:hypothetical protein [Paenibacillus popilliae]|uniref:Uncharacterized protein n=1 Tax=Paenibacillus popilliae ATCC 14706 TaxID=1212764 RepID=M9LJN9_PAEPP|nr:hypothetical protein [Paenibacillus popilliae]GAC43465.1 hypothetical protein PPOP_2848 [Paenibacillus popilliae ATCC 14706]